MALSDTIEFNKELAKAKKGDHNAQYQVAMAYYNGKGVAKNNVKVYEWFAKSVEDNKDLSLWRMGWCHQFGIGVPCDNNLAVQWYKKSMHQAKDAYSFGLDGWASIDAKGAFLYLVEQSTGGKTYFQYLLGKCYLNGYLAKYSSASNSAFSEYYKIVGQYAHCKELLQNLPLGEEWLTKSARQGFSPAQLCLVKLYWEEEFAPRNLDKCVYWYHALIKNKKSTSVERDVANYTCLNGIIADIEALEQTDFDKAMQLLYLVADAGQEKQQLRLYHLCVSNKYFPPTTEESLAIYYMIAHSYLDKAIREDAQLRWQQLKNYTNTKVKRTD